MDRYRYMKVEQTRFAADPDIGVTAIVKVTLSTHENGGRELVFYAEGDLAEGLSGWLG